MFDKKVELGYFGPKFSNIPSYLSYEKITNIFQNFKSSQKLPSYHRNKFKISHSK